VLNKIYTYITLPNTDLIEETKINQIAVHNLLIDMRKQLTPGVIHAPEHRVTLDTSRWNIWGRFQQWRAQRKNNQILAKHAVALENLPLLPNTAENARAREAWIAALTKLTEAFPQQ
jgi:hypothetical protein